MQANFSKLDCAKSNAGRNIFMEIKHFKKFFSDKEKESIQKHADHIEKRMHEFAVNQTVDNPELSFQEAKNQFLIILWAEKRFADHIEAISQSNQNY